MLFTSEGNSSRRLSDVTENQNNLAFSSDINVCPGSTPTLGTASSQGIGTSQSNLILNEDDSSTSSTSSIEDIESLIDWGSDSTWPDLSTFASDWGTQAIEEQPWDDKDKPYANHRCYQDLQLSDTEYKGILTDRIIAVCSSYLDRSPVTGKYVLCKVDLSKKLLLDISILKYHHYLQFVDLSWNELADVEALGQLPFLMYLNVSHNFLLEVLNFKPPFYLTYVNYSHNLIKHIDDLSKFWSLVHLDLSRNRIKIIEGLQELKFLRHLNLSFNLIECIENLNHMRLQTLNITNNNISKYEEGEDVGLKTLIDLVYINLSYNRLRSLKLLQGIPGIQSINAVGNVIDNLLEITYLKGLNFLSEVDFRENPIVRMKHYAATCINTISYLYMLDGDFVDAQKKVIVKNDFDPCPYIEAAKTSANILFLQQINDPVLGLPVITSDQPPPPIIVLIGPPGSGKGQFLRHFCKHHKRYTILGVSHTTRYKHTEELENESYYFVDEMEFREMALKGEFLTVSHTLGNFFGLAQTELVKTHEKCATLMLHMDLSGALTLRAKGFRCRLILAMPSTTEIHKIQILEKYYNRHECYKYLGAVQVENCPAKAKKFLTEHDIHIRPSVTKLAKTIINELLESTFLQDDTADHISEMSETKSILSNRTGSSMDSGKVISSSSRTSGILKASSTKSSRTNETQQPRTSVTFQDLVKDVSPAQSQTKMQLSRSVTFSDMNESTPSFDIPTQSISGTLIRDEEPVILSVLSGSQLNKGEDITSQEDTSKIWDVQTEAFKNVVDDIINLRDTYLKTHHSNPGLFCEVIFIDKPERAWKKLKRVLKESIQQQKDAKPCYEIQKDSVYKIFVATRLGQLHREIKGQLSISDKQMDALHEPTAKLTPALEKKSKVEVIEGLRKTRQKAVGYKLPPDVSFNRRRSSVVSGADEETEHPERSSKDDCYN